eukprot:209909-Pleurochrysis_carterae.AAC.1
MHRASVTGSRLGNGGNARGVQGFLRCAVAELERWSRQRVAVLRWRRQVRKEVKKERERFSDRRSWNGNEMCGASPRPWR